MRHWYEGVYRCRPPGFSTPSRPPTAKDTDLTQLPALLHGQSGSFTAIGATSVPEANRYFCKQGIHSRLQKGVASGHSLSDVEKARNKCWSRGWAFVEHPFKVRYRGLVRARRISSPSWRIVRLQNGKNGEKDERQTRKHRNTNIRMPHPGHSIRWS